MKFNYKGYICLRNSIFFGGGCVIVIRWVQPMVEKAIDAIPVNVGMAIVIVMAVLIAVDTVVSLMAVKKLNERFRRIDEISRLMLSGSVKVGMKLASGTLKVKSNVDKIMDVKDNVVEKVQDINSANMDRLKSEYSRLVEEKDAFTERLAKTLMSHKYSESLRAVKDKLRGRITEIGISDNDEDDDENE